MKTFGIFFTIGIFSLFGQGAAQTLQPSELQQWLTEREATTQLLKDLKEFRKQTEGKSAIVIEIGRHISFESKIFNTKT